MKSTKKTFLFILMIALLTIAGWFVFKFFYFLNTPLVAKDGAPVKFLFAQGTTVKQAAYSLQQRRLLDHPLFFVLFVRLSNAEYNLQAGEYVIEPGLTPRKLVQKMVKGEMLHHTFTIIEGWTFAQIVTALNNNQYITHTMHKLESAEIMAKIGHPGELPEGRFAPQTYVFSGNLTDKEILQNAYYLMQKDLQAAWENRAKGLWYHCPYQALIVASLIEKETAVAQEKPLIAGIILRRLEKGMLLQVDPAVIYGLGAKFTGKLSKKDLLKATPYNTYRHQGLSPTPISMPSKDSITAALHPTSSNYLYYVTKGDGIHEFSETLKNQQKAIKKYLLRK